MQKTSCSCAWRFVETLKPEGALCTHISAYKNLAKRAHHFVEMREGYGNGYGTRHELNQGDFLVRLLILRGNTPLMWLFAILPWKGTFQGGVYLTLPPHPSKWAVGIGSGGSPRNVSSARKNARKGEGGSRGTSVFHYFSRFFSSKS